MILAFTENESPPSMRAYSYFYTMLELLSLCRRFLVCTIIRRKPLLRFILDSEREHLLVFTVYIIIIGIRR